MFEDPGVDAIYVANANRDHAATVAATIDARMPTLCEKPLTSQPGMANAVIENARSKNVLLMEAVSTPFLPAVDHALRWARLRPEIRFDASFGYPLRKADQRAVMAKDAGVVLDRAIYPLTLARLACGSGSIVHTELRFEGEVDVNVEIVIAHDCGAISRSSASFVHRLANRLSMESGSEAIAIPAPLLAASRVILGTTRAARGEQNALLRRVYEAKARWSGNAFGFGADASMQELNHFSRLVVTAQNESPILTYDVTADVHRWIEIVKRR